ncbi:MAG: hypothetical protein AB1689_05895, partial [Thermodesulfobacteriota bacterium]
MRKAPLLRPLLLATLAASLAGPAAAQTRGKVTRESVDSLGAGAALGGSRPSLSADGRFIAFDSASDDLVPNDTNQDTDVFVRDRETGVVQRVSLAWNGMEARDDSVCPDISADGRYVAFRSLAWNLYPGGANLGSPRSDVYVHDRQQGTTTRVSVPEAGGDPNGDSGCPAISGDGQRVVFDSVASNLVAGDDNGSADVFLVDLATSTLELVSAAATGGVANAGGSDPDISRDGRIVAFSTYSTDLEPTGPLPPP